MEIVTKSGRNHGENVIKVEEMSLDNKMNVKRKSQKSQSIGASMSLKECDEEPMIVKEKGHEDKTTIVSDDDKK